MPSRRWWYSKSPCRQTVSEIAIMTGGTFERSFWTRILAEKGLESPGRDEAVERTMEKSLRKSAFKKRRWLLRVKREEEKVIPVGSKSRGFTL